MNVGSSFFFLSSSFSIDESETSDESSSDELSSLESSELDESEDISHYYLLNSEEICNGPKRRENHILLIYFKIAGKCEIAQIERFEMIWS